VVQLVDLTLRSVCSVAAHTTQRADGRKASTVTAPR